MAEANLQGLTPEASDALSRLQAAMAAKGITTHVNSAFRTYEDQRQLYENWQAGRAGRPLPYPDRGSVALAARPGYSPHEFGVAFDLSPSDPSRRGEMDSVARSLGLATVAGDPGHYQLASWHGGHTASDVPAAHTGSTTMANGSGPHGVAGTSVSSGDGSAQPPVDFRNSVFQTLIGRGLSPQQAMGAMYSLMGESGHGLDPGAYNSKDPGGAMGFAQWTGSRRAGLQAVAKSMGVPETDPSAQLAYFNQELDGKYKGVIDNIKNNATSAADATRIWTADFEAPKVNNWHARFAQGVQIGSVGDDGAPKWNSAPAATAPAATATTTPDDATKSTPGPPKSVADALATLTKEDDKTGKSPLDKLGQSFSPKAPPQMSAPEMAQAAPDESMALAGPSQQLFSQTLAAQSRPLSWSTMPFGSGTAGLQPPGVPGMTLNSAPQPRTLSDYSLNPMYS